MSSSRSTHWKSDAALLFTVLVWGINMPVLKAALTAMPIHVLNAIRFLVSAIVLGTTYYLWDHSGSPGLLSYARRYALQIIGLSLVGYILYQMFFIYGIGLTTAGNAALIMASAPIWTAVVGRLFGFETLDRRTWMSLLIVFSGTLLVVVAGSHEFDFSSKTFAGNLLMVVASMFWGSYTAFSRPLVRHISPTALSFLGICVALPVLSIIGLPSLPDVEWGKVDAWVWAAIVFSGGLSTGLTFVIWATAVRNVGASQTAVYGNLVPFVAVAGSYVILGEAVYLAQLAGGLLIIGGLIAMRRARKIPESAPVGD